MAYVFGLRGNSFDARYAGGYKEATYLSSSTPTIVTDVSAIGGEAIDLTGYSGLTYSGRGNWSETGDFSLLTRVKFSALGSTVSMIFSFGRPSKRGSYPIFETYMFQSAGGFRTYHYNDAGFIGISGSYISDGTMVVDTWYDLGFTWNNTTKQFKIYKDGTLLNTLTSSVAPISNPAIWGKTGLLSFGWGNEWHATFITLGEAVAWDTIVDFSSATALELTTGSGAANGASRTAFVNVPEYDGLASGGGKKSFGEFGMS